MLGFDYLLVSPFHELGHALAAYMLGIKIVRIGWSWIQYVPSPNWYANVIAGMAGGLFAAFVLCIYYIGFSRALNRLINHIKQTESRRVFTGARLALRIIIMADLLSQLSLGILEGIFNPLYRALITNIPIAFTLLIIFVAVSFIIHRNQNTI